VCVCVCVCNGRSLPGAIYQYLDPKAAFPVAWMRTVNRVKQYHTHTHTHTHTHNIYIHIYI
jgi:hypothetical protein